MTARKTQSTAFLLTHLLGYLGIDRFYLGHTTLGILKLLTLGGFGIWYMVDHVLIGIGRVKDAEGRLLSRPQPVGRPVKTQEAAFLLSAFLGYLGVDRFYLGYTTLGILKLLTFGGCGLWALIDMVLLGVGVMKDADGNSLVWPDRGC